MSESVEVTMAVMKEQLKAISISLAEDRTDRKERDKQITKIEKTTDTMETRLAVVEAQLASNAPTIQEFVNVKQQAIGGGKLGRWAWNLATGTIALISALYAGRGIIRTWLTGAGS